MSTRTLMIAAFALVFTVGLAGCATQPPSDSFAARHQHMRDAKQGPAMPYAGSSEAPKPLHDHREMK